MKMGKTRTLTTKHDITRSEVKNATRKARQRPAYDHREYDGHQGSEGIAVEA